MTLWHHAHPLIAAIKTRVISRCLCILRKAWLRMHACINTIFCKWAFYTAALLNEFWVGYFLVILYIWLAKICSLLYGRFVAVDGLASGHMEYGQITTGACRCSIALSSRCCVNAYFVSSSTRSCREYSCKIENSDYVVYSLQIEK